MQVVIAAVGKVKDRGLRALLEDYYKRIGRFARFEEIEIKDAPTDRLVERFDKLRTDRSTLVALEVEGKSLSSRELADFLQKQQVGATQRLIFAIGGAYGLPQEVSQKADLTLSLSAMTLPHRLARLVLAEQIYRAFTIIGGQPYDH